MKKIVSMLLALMLVASMLAMPAMAEGGDKIIKVAIADNPEQMDPTLNSYARSSLVLQNLFTGLYRMAPDGSYVPGMAESYELSDDSLTYTFTLRDGLKWSDGSDLTAYDFEYSWLRVLNPDVASRCSSDLEVVKNGAAYNTGECTAEEVGVKAVDEKTFVVELERPTPWFLALTATTSFFPVKKELVESNENWTADVSTYVCNGPFVLTEYASLSHLLLTPNANYFAADDVKIDGVRFSIIPDAATELTAYNNDEINVAFISNTISNDAITQYQGSDELRSQGKLRVAYNDFNTQLPEFSDKRVRQAFSMAINREQLLQAMQSTDEPLYGFVPYSQPSLTDPSKSYRDIAGDMIVEDVEAAQALMAEAGYPNGEGFPVVEIVTQNDTQQRLMAQVLGEFWKQNLGVEYTITSYESSSYWDELNNGNFSVDRNGYTVDYMDPSANLRIWITGSNASENGWDDPVYDQMFEDAMSNLDPAAREAALIEVEKYLVDEMPGFPYASTNSYYLVKPGIDGITMNAIGHMFFEYATME